MQLSQVETRVVFFHDLIAQQIKRATTDFTQKIIHQPLTYASAISGYLDQLQSLPKDSPERAFYYDDIEPALAWLLRTLDWSRAVLLPPEQLARELRALDSATLDNAALRSAHRQFLQRAPAVSEFVTSR